MKLRVLTVGVAPGWIDDGFAEYAHRLPVERLELVVVSARRGRTNEQRLLDAVRERETLVVLDRCGTAVSSEDLAALMAEWRMQGRDVAFLVGGVEGLSPQARQRANHVLSLSRLTLPHLLVRVVLAEQLYRAAMILAGHPYHR
ncbi:MAG: 23S rRNA (pseudouridine(1915)-N(3))-methyltransferase RlmH [Gammaproteobacteria bacterium]|nr:23S rRNA (pseudouridine(1915)-N(3))-methyltransferase RlmH [Gammaproteobacteria bacterium]MYF31034.1 23S rRNA (pseudouridine(1915)-N(3))-methyltransferase RlmH [Gammaproteobacteria bacterium]MYK44955.1 23S rRNA (pseudouridine(1915)-N(3))-methyltransferase RlmH [Gammaproteobacteria bacterium]